MPDARRVLGDAIGTGELISIVYFGGSQPGHRREIQPLRVTGEHVHAMCAETGERRTFLLDKLALADGALASAPQYRTARQRAVDAAYVAPPGPRGLSGLQFVGLLLALGVAGGVVLAVFGRR